MAKQTIVRLIDDLDQSEATRTIAFSWNGTAYEIDLSAKNARAFEAAIQPYLNVARRAPSGRGAGGRRGGGAKLDLAAVRAWALENGHKVAERGRIPSPVLEAFHAAQHAVADLSGPASAPPAKRPTKRPAKRASGKASAKRPARKTTKKASKASR